MQNNRKGCIRVISERFSDETKAPTLAPRWTRAGYEGRLKDAVTEACSDQDEDENGVEDQENDQGEKTIREEKTKREEKTGVKTSIFQTTNISRWTTIDFC